MVNGTVMQRSGLNSDYHILFGRVRVRSGSSSGTFGRVRASFSMARMDLKTAYKRPKHDFLNNTTFTKNTRNNAI